jgi:signal recognition particle receptor subunit beta
MIIQQYKIVFAGSMGAGKTEAIRSLSDIPVLATEVLNTDAEAHQKAQTTVGIDYGEFTLADGLTVGLYGTPGQSRFDFMWSIICKGAIGIVILIDHTHPEPLNELSIYIDTFKEYGNNIAIGVTHHDEDAQKSLQPYRAWLAERQLKYPLFFVDARQSDHVLLLVDALITPLEITTMTHG